MAVGQIAKSVIFRRKSDDAAVLVVTSGDRRVDEKRVAAITGPLGRADADYLQFRAQVRGLGWQQAFLARPLAERRAIAAGLRGQSEARKHSGVPYADVDEGAASAWLQAAHAHELIHGHTHRPADHALGATGQRHVLSDWDAAATPARLEVLRLQQGPTGLQLQRLPLARIRQGG